MKIGVPKEVAEGERRVALVPDGVSRLANAGLEVLVEAGAGEAAWFSDDRYREAGAAIVPSASELFSQADVVVKVQKPQVNQALGTHELDLIPSGAVLIGLLQPLLDPDLVSLLASRRITSFSMDAVPRIARAQPMDALTSQASLAGYKAALLAADTLGKFFPMMMTAAGTIPPARVLVIGTGVAGLQAIATARRLGAVVQGYDIRPVTREQVESLGATFISPQVVEQTETAGGYATELAAEAQQREREVLHTAVRGADAIVTTALIPGKRAPVLITEAMVRDMQPGSVIVDLAAEMGGNCELTEAGAEAVKHGVTICGPLNLPSSMPVHASHMYSRNISNILLHLIVDGALKLDLDDAITAGCCITHDGEIVNAQVRSMFDVRGSKSEACG